MKTLLATLICVCGLSVNAAFVPQFGTTNTPTALTNIINSLAASAPNVQLSNTFAAQAQNVIGDIVTNKRTAPLIITNRTSIYGGNQVTNPFIFTNMVWANPGSPSGLEALPVLAIDSDIQANYYFRNSANQTAFIRWNPSHNGLNEPELDISSDDEMAIGWGLSQAGVSGPHQSRGLQIGVNMTQHPFMFWEPEAIPYGLGTTNLNLFPGLLNQFFAYGTNGSGAFAIGSGLSTASTFKYPTFQTQAFDPMGRGAFAFFSYVDAAITSGNRWDYANSKRSFDVLVGPALSDGGFRSYGNGIVDGSLSVGGGFDPADVSGLAMRLDPDAHSLPDGTTTNKIMDLSTNAWHPFNSANVITYSKKTGTNNGRAYVTFDGVNGHAPQTNFTTQLLNTNTIYAVMKIDNTVDTDNFLWDSGASGAAGRLFAKMGARKLGWGTSGSGEYDESGYLTNQWGLFKFKYSGSASVLQTNMVNLGTENFTVEGQQGITIAGRSNNISVGQWSLGYLLWYNKDVGGIEDTNICDWVNRRFGFFASPPAVPGLYVRTGTTNSLTMRDTNRISSTYVYSQGGTLYSQSGVIGGSALPVAFTNWISGQLYTNTSSADWLVRSSAKLTTAAVTGDAGMELQTSVQGGTLAPISAAEMQTTVAVTIAMVYTNEVAGFVPSGNVFTFTNISSGTGNSGALVAGTGQRKQF